MRRLSDIDAKGRVVLLRLDLNCPLDGMGGVADDAKIEASLPTIRWIVEQGGRVVAMSHLGRPRGHPDPKLSLAPVAARLGERLGQTVPLAPGVVGSDVASAVADLDDGGCLLLENLRFDPGERANDPDFVGQLAALSEAYVNDAFATCHRAHASVAGLPGRLPAAAGLRLEEELEAIGGLLGEPARPYVAILGGAKVSDKIPVVRHLLPRVDRILLGGGMAYTFLVARGEAVGSSLLDRQRVDLARGCLEDGGDRILLPTDHVVRTEAGSVETTAEIPEGAQGRDIGPATRGAFGKALAGARTVVWNGPLGVFEEEDFSGGTRAMAEAVAGLGGARTILGGGDTIAAVRRLSRPEVFGYLSTGGGAFLEYLSGRTLPGLAALEAASNGAASINS